MKRVPSNPGSNKLGSGVTEKAVNEAVAKSGYPLQTIIARSLRGQEFGVNEEWSYIDRDTSDLRTLDIMAAKLFYDFESEPTRVRPTLNLLIECKQSNLPFIFFSASGHILISVCVTIKKLNL